MRLLDSCGADWCLNPDSSDTGGLVRFWNVANQIVADEEKLSLLSRLPATQVPTAKERDRSPHPPPPPPPSPSPAALRPRPPPPPPPASHVGMHAGSQPTPAAAATPAHFAAVPAPDAEAPPASLLHQHLHAVSSTGPLGGVGIGGTDTSSSLPSAHHHHHHQSSAARTASHPSPAGSPLEDEAGALSEEEAAPSTNPGTSPPSAWVVLVAPWVLIGALAGARLLLRAAGVDADGLAREWLSVYVQLYEDSPLPPYVAGARARLEANLGSSLSWNAVAEAGGPPAHSHGSYTRGTARVNVGRQPPLCTYPTPPGRVLRGVQLQAAGRPQRPPQGGAARRGYSTALPPPAARTSMTTGNRTRYVAAAQEDSDDWGE